MDPRLNLLCRKALALLAVILGLTAGTVCVALLNNHWHRHYGDMLLREWCSFIGFAACAFCLIVGSIVSIVRAKPGSILLLASIPLPFLLNVAGASFWHVTAVLSAFLFAIVMFWLNAFVRQWPTLVHIRAENRARALLLLSTLLVGTIVLGAVSSIWFVPPLVVDCGETPPFASQQYPGEAVFVGTIVWVAPFERDDGAPWSIIRVDREFFGVPSVMGFVLGGPASGELKGIPLFLDARRGDGLWTQFLPFLEFNHCSASRKLNQANAHIRALERGPSSSGVRIVGTVLGRAGKENRGVAGVDVEINSSAGTITTTTDKDGVYEVSGLPPGRYGVKLAGESKEDESTSRRDLKPGETWGSTLYHFVASP